MNSLSKWAMSACLFCFSLPAVAEDKTPVWTGYYPQIRDELPTGVQQEIEHGLIAYAEDPPQKTIPRIHAGKECPKNTDACFYMVMVDEPGFCGSIGCPSEVYRVLPDKSWKKVCVESLDIAPDMLLDQFENGRWQYRGGEGLIHWTSEDRGPDGFCWMENHRDALRYDIIPAPLEDGTKVAHAVKVKKRGAKNEYTFRAHTCEDTGRPCYAMKGRWTSDKVEYDHPVAGAFISLDEDGARGEKPRHLCTLQGAPDSIQLLENIENGRHMLMTNAGAVHWREDGTCWQNYMAKGSISVEGGWTVP